MNLPEQFETYTSRIMGDKLWDAYKKAFDEPQPVSIRVNPYKYAPQHDISSFIDSNVRWCEGGFYLKERPSFTADPLFHAGTYYVQEASSMFLDRVIRSFVKESVVMLDLCAAPGGKSTLARTAIPEGSLLMCNEPMKQRANILSENIKKFGSPQVIVTNNFPADYRKSGLMFDIILTDVPCSGEGMFRKDEGAISEWSVQNVDNCRKKQREIVEDIWHCLKPGGILIYSTCTFNLGEDEDNVKWIADELGGEILTVDIHNDEGIAGCLSPDFDIPVYRFIPGVTRGEGMFMAAIRKTDGEVMKNKKRKGKGIKSIKYDNSPLTDAFKYFEAGNKIVAVPDNMCGIYETACESLHILHAGVCIGERKGKDIIPDQSLALTTALREDAFPRAEVTREDALAYLSRETITLPADTPRGFVLLTYNKIPLGFVKNIGNRVNNLYPAEWKIRNLK